jgi:hypothetical protein
MSHIGNGTEMVMNQVSSSLSTNCVVDLRYGFLFWYGMAEELPQIGSYQETDAFRDEHFISG